MSLKPTYEAPSVVNVDKETADFIEDAEKWAATAREKSETIRTAKTNQALFKLGTLAFLAGEPPEEELMSNSDAYFQGYDFGRRLTNEIGKEAKKRFPSDLGNPEIEAYANALLKQKVEIKYER